MKIREIKFQKKSLELLKQIKEILEQFEKQNIKITLRQLYYQLVAKDLIPNTEKQYKKISKLLTDARYSGLVDWGAIEDRTRKPVIPNTFENITELLKIAKDSYQLNRWEDQDFYLEVWTEKDAISSVLIPILKKYQVPLIINRGYNSASSMYENAQRLLNHKNKKLILLYLGDHDPSGLDMDRDIKTRLKEFKVNVEVIRIGLTFEQVQKYNPPENPTKLKDTRAKDYVEKYGSKCWEVDAIKPEVLQQLIEISILEHLDLYKFEQVQKREIIDLERFEQ
jgi:hypothetical protein